VDRTQQFNEVQLQQFAKITPLSNLHILDINTL